MISSHATRYGTDPDEHYRDREERALRRCTVPGCTNEMHRQSESAECSRHTFEGCAYMLARDPWDQEVQADYAKWYGILEDEG